MAAVHNLFRTERVIGVLLWVALLVVLLRFATH